MKTQTILVGYPESALDQLASDKIAEATNLRLPRAVVTQEIASVLSSYSYVAKVLSASRPPTYAFLCLLLEAPEFKRQIDGFQDLVVDHAKILSGRAKEGDGLSSEKNYGLYLRMLRSAWESEGQVDVSEYQLLGALRTELKIWMREHLLLEHHPSVRSLWDVDTAFIGVRNHLLATGLVMTLDDHYVLPEEVAVQVKRFWQMELDDTKMMRLLDIFSGRQLHELLEKCGLPVAGSKEERVARLAKSYVPATDLLDMLSIGELKDACRECGAPIAGVKAEVIEGMVKYFGQDRDLTKEEHVEEPPPPSAPEARDLHPHSLSKLLHTLTNDELYDILSGCNLRVSGSKDEKVARLVESTWAERTMLGHMRNIDLYNLCQRLSIHSSGVKQEKIDRTIEHAAVRVEETTTKAELEDEKVRTARPSPQTEKEAPEDIPADRPVAVPPALVKEVETAFPFLDPDEHIVVALVKEARSLTEHDVERAAANHGLGWFLTKAHMAEMMRKMAEKRARPLNVRSVRSVNIYEWIGGGAGAEDGREQRIARVIIDALRQGVVPGSGLTELAVGQPEIREHLKELLGEGNSKKSAFKFIRGSYGAGKTFLCSWLREYASTQGFAVASVTIGPDQPLSDLPIFYSGFIHGLRTPQKHDSSALADILESWLISVHRRTAKLEEMKPFDRATRKRLAPIVEKRIEEELAGLANLDPGFAPALRSFYRARLTGDQATASVAVSWLGGSAAMPGTALRKIGVRGQLEASQVFPRMRALLEVIGGAQYSGLLLVVDELELVRKFPHAREREQAYETLRLLIDETGKNGFPGCVLILTGTDAFFDDDRAGLKSYEALANRVATPESAEGLRSMRQPVVRLEGIAEERLLAMVRRIRDIHGAAYRWDASVRVPDAVLEKLVKDWTAYGEGNVARLPRPILRELVNILDVCEENPGVSPEDCTRPPSQPSTSQNHIAELLKG